MGGLLSALSSLRRPVPPGVPPPIDPSISGSPEYQDEQQSSDPRTGAMPGTGQARIPSESVASSSPSAVAHPPSGHGDDNDDILTRIPKLQMPDIESLPGTEHIHQLQSELEASRHPHLSLGQKVASWAARLGPTALGAAFGGLRGAGAAAGGTAEGIDENNKLNLQRQGELLRQISEEQGARGQIYQAQAHTNLANAQMQSNALIRDMMARNQAGIAQGHDTTRRDVATAGNESKETIAGNKLDHQKIVDQAKMDYQQSLKDLADARAKGIPAQIKIAQDRADATKQFADAAQRRAQVMEDSYERDTFGTQSGAPIPGAPTDQSGQVIGFKPYSATGPTAATRTKLGQGNAIQTAAGPLVDYINAHKNTLGPAMGRAHSLAEFLGADTEDSRKLRGLFDSWVALHPAFHGFRGTNALEKFDQSVGGYKQTPKGFVASIQGLTEGVKNASEGMKAPTIPTVGHGAGTARPRHGVNAPPPPAQVEQWERGPDGKLRKVGG